jgi:hypothetical protein
MGGGSVNWRDLAQDRDSGGLLSMWLHRTLGDLTTGQVISTSQGEALIFCSSPYVLLLGTAIAGGRASIPYVPPAAAFGHH